MLQPSANLASASADRRAQKRPGGGDGEAERSALMQMAQRTRSNPSINPETEAELGKGGNPQGTRH